MSKVKERKGKERKGKERKGKERKGKERNRVHVCRYLCTTKRESKSTQLYQAQTLQCIKSPKSQQIYIYTRTHIHTHTHTHHDIFSHLLDAKVDDETDVTH